MVSSNSPANQDAYITLQADVDYEGSYDIRTGLPLHEAETAVKEAPVSDSSSYDFSLKMFRFPIGDSTSSVYASVAADMVTKQPVTITADEGGDIALYRDGTRLDANFSEPISMTGKYDLLVEQVDNEYQLFSFMIVGDRTGLLQNYPMPDGFYVTGLTVDGSPMPLRQTGMVDLTAEGDYEITYRCSATNSDYYLEVTVDHTPPEIVCEGVSNGYARGPVVVNGIESTDTVSLLFEGESVKMPSNHKLISPGTYELTVKDDAGNIKEQQFTIRMYLNSQGLIFSIFAVALIAALGIYIFTIKKRLRVQ